MTTDPRAIALDHLGPHMGGWTGGGDPDEEAYPDLVHGAVHEAGHATAMAVLRIPGVHVELATDISGHVRFEDVNEVSHDNHAVVALGGVAAQGELHHALWNGECGLGGRYATAIGGSSDLAEIQDGVVLHVAEAMAIAVIRSHWEPVCRLAAALLDAPNRWLSWEQVLDVLGPQTVGLGLNMGAVQTALDELQSGVVERYTNGTIAGYDGP